ncbi:MAG TPA: VTT domain-containing protein [Gammaproteobacteria bacterium]
MDSLVTALFTWIEQHPHIAGLGVAVLCFAESLALVGFLLPGAALMFGIGALVGSGVLELWPTLFWSALGAISGDGVSFWLGKRFHQRIRVIWPFSRYPDLIARSTDFFHRHGAKSIVFARFIGPLRPIVPAVAGMLDMPSRRFFVVNVISGIFWAPVYVIPGMVFAASLGLAAEVATRLAVMIGVVIVLVLLAVWLARLLYRLFHPRALPVINRLLAWSELHPVAGRLPAALLDPEHPEARGLTLMAVILLLATLAFALLLTSLGGDRINSIDSLVLNELQALRTPWVDQFMVGITEMGDAAVLAPLFAALLGWLLWKRRWMAAAHWCGATLFALALTQVLKWSTHITRPNEIYTGISALSFPSGHSTLSAVIYGFLAVLIAREVRGSLRWIVYAVFTALIAAVAFSRLYLGVHWLSDIMGGLILGLIWVALLGIAYRRHPASTLPLGGLLLITSLTSVAAFGVHNSLRFEDDMRHYARKVEYRTLSQMEWWASSWRTLPSHRNDLSGWRSQPLSVQYAGDLTTLQAMLIERGWKQPHRADAINWLQWFDGTIPAQKQPLLPQLHDGHIESLLLINQSRAPWLLALRLWDSGIRQQPGDVPLWIGNVVYLAVPPEASLHLPRVQLNFDDAFDDFMPEVSALDHRLFPGDAQRSATLLIKDRAPQ